MNLSIVASRLVLRSIQHTARCLAIAILACTSASVSQAAKPEAPPFAHGAWPFCSPERPEVPAVERIGWVANPIDAFILEELEAIGIEPSAEADRLTLLRRVTFDLTGLPPTPQEQAAFLADTADNAYDRVVERLLSSPRYGERWAQHWLDLVRYAETNGFKADELRPLAHKYRDYCIQAFNDDLPYDRFIQQQFAGDELEPDNPWALVATGLNRLYPDESNAADLRLRRQQILDDVTETTGLVFLGLTMGCASCHDHKFDDILQTDYYQLQAFFTPMLPVDSHTVAAADDKRAYDEQLAVWEEATRDVRDQIAAIVEPVRERAYRASIKKYDDELQQLLLKPEHERTAYERQIAAQAVYYLEPKIETALKAIKSDAKKRLAALERRLAEFDHLKPQPLAQAMCIVDAGSEPPPTYVLATGNVYKPTEPVEPGFPAFLGAADVPVEPPVAGASTTGRRTALARWLTRGDHPLTARVMVNRLWQHHFAQGIVASPNDFGAMGEAPSHPRLLDWLAVEFVDSGWSLKELHRLMVTSNTYKQSSIVDPADPGHEHAAAEDPSNRLLWHQRRRRLEGEAVRDAMLAITGDLNLRMYGPSAQPDLPAKISRYAWEPDADVADRNRRSIYVLAKRNMRFPLFEAFDQPDMHHSCGRRAVTTTALQSLMLINSDFTWQCAQRWATALVDEHRAAGELIDAAYRQAFGRPPEADEAAMAERFLASESAPARDGSAEQAGRSRRDLDLTVRGVDMDAAASFCHALLNTNEFLYVD